MRYRVPRCAVDGTEPAPREVNLMAAAITRNTGDKMAISRSFPIHPSRASSLGPNGC